MTRLRVKKEVIEVGGHLKELITVKDDKGNVLHKSLTNLMVEFRHKDVLQVIIGASILAIPVGFTEETWKLGLHLPWLNVLGLMLLSLLFISTFTYYHYFRDVNHNHWEEFFKRVFFTYLLAFCVVALLLTLIEVTPWLTDFGLAAKRTVIVSFPASLSGAVADVIK